MKDRILKNWTIVRVLYVVFGLIMILNSIKMHQWIGVVFGMYFMSMGIFAFGCASGNCASFTNTSNSNLDSKELLDQVEYEEIKLK